jgi:alpha,alpha-trehalase
MRAADAAAAANIAPQILREYALLADGERGALVGPNGEMAWLCVPRWDDDAVFAGLIGGDSGYTVIPQVPHVWGGYYEQGSLIWRGRWATHDGIVESREALAMPADPHRAVLMRRIIAVDCDVRMRVALAPRAAFGKHGLTDLHRERGVWTGRSGPIRLRWTGAGSARAFGRHPDAILGMDLVLRAGTHHDLVLELSDRPLPDEPVDVDDAWTATTTAWASAVPELGSCASPTETRHSYAVLRGLTSHTHGMVAAVTTSLPERAEAGRNYDYRYAWIRDQAIAGQAVAAAGAHPLLTDAVSFVSARLHDHGDRLAPAYTVDGGPVPGQRQLPLPGYPGGYNLLGNHVNAQFQLDAFGESLLLLAAAARHDCLDDDAVRAAEIAVAAIERRWCEPDAGIWELDPRPWTHSRLMCVAGLRAFAGARPDSGRTGDWLALADKILADTAATSLHPSGRWQRAPEDPRVDGALLFSAVRGALAADDPRSVATLRAYENDLTRDGFAFRFRHDDRPLPAAEGSFLLCGFLTALATEQIGEHAKAVGWYERSRAACGPSVLYSEEYDTREHQMRGNLPQAFVHAMQLEASVRIGPESSATAAPPTPSS